MVGRFGIVSLLDPMATRKVEETWDRLDRDFGTRGVRIMPYPHFSYQIAHGYDRERVEAVLAGLARQIPPFSVRTRGISTFPGDFPVVFVAVEATPPLRAVHRRVFAAGASSAREVVEYYRPDVWVPHITLADGDERNSVPLLAETVRSIVSALDPAEYRWEIRINNLALVWDEGEVQRPVATFRLTGE